MMRMAVPPKPAADSGVHPLAWGGLSVIAGFAAVVMLLSLDRYEYFGDELYFLAGGDRLAAGYADQGPALPALAHLMDTVAPGSLFVSRLPAALLTVGAIMVTALIARELGGGSAAQLISAGAYATSPFLLGQGVLLSTNAVDTALWTVITWLVVRWVRVRADWLLLLAAVVTALDFQVKWLIPFFWICAGISILILGPRDLLRRPMLWLGAMFVIVSALPGLLWQAERGWPQLKMGAIIAAEQSTVMGRWLFVPLALLSAGLLGMALLTYGTWRLFRAPALREDRFVALTVLLLVAVFVLQGGRSYYVAGMYPVLMAAGAVELTRRGLRRWVRCSAVPVVAASLALSLVALPWRPTADVAPANTRESATIMVINYRQHPLRRSSQVQPTAPIPGRFLYVAWNVSLRLIGPFVTPSRARHRALDAIRSHIGALESIPGIGSIRLLESTFVVPLPGAPRFDVALLVDGSDAAVETAQSVVGQLDVGEHWLMTSACNVKRFGDTDGPAGPILLNHFASSRSSSDVAGVWSGISEWYGRVLGVDNSTLLALDESDRYVMMNYARIPGSVVRFMADQVLRPSFRSHVVGPLKSLDARALPVFARRIRPSFE